MTHLVRILRWCFLGTLSLGFLPACRDEPTRPSTYLDHAPQFAVVDNVVAKVTVAPDSQLVFVGDQLKFTAKPFNAAGQLLTTTITWTVGNLAVVKPVGTSQPTMTFQALKTGITTVKATTGGKSRTAKLVVRSTTGAKVVVTPAQATVVTGKTVKFTATGLTNTGETAAVNVTWTATGGSVSSSGLLTAGTTPGKYRIIATSRFGAADTSTVTITAPAPVVDKVVVVPGAVTLAPATTKQFAAYGRTSAGDSVAVSVTYTSTGGTIAGSGMYTAGASPGNYRVIGKTAAGPADTAEVSIESAAVSRVSLQPDIAASRPGTTTKFVATAYTTVGISSAEPVSYGSTCGSITTTGVFSAPLSGSANCLITASAGGKADTTELVLLRDSPGIPFGTTNLWASATSTYSSHVAPFTASNGGVAASTLVSQIAAARSIGVRMMLQMTGGSHDRFKTNGVFDLTKWQATMDQFNTPAIRAAVADGVADGTIIGNSVMDEPQQSDGKDANPSKSWGPAGTMTRERVDGLCSYVKAIFPTLPVGVFHNPLEFEPSNPYRVCQFLIIQYATRKGPVTTFRDVNLDYTARDGMSTVFSINLLDGGTQDKDAVYDCTGTGGMGTYKPNCQMTPQQVRDYGRVLGPAGCAMMTWKYDATFMGKPENQAALSETAVTLSQLPRVPCSGNRQPNTAPTAAFVASCTHLDCSFTDGSNDADGRLTSWSWDFGDGSSSVTQNPNHAYQQPGSYQVSLTVTDDDDVPATVTRTVTVTAPPPINQPPTASFSSSCTDLSCSFTDASSDDGAIDGWSWDFGDSKGSSSRSPDHAYDQAGDYEVSLTVTDNDGATDSHTRTITVTAPPAPNQPPAAAFAFNCTDLECSFADQSTDGDGTVDGWHWDFGDGTTSSGQHPDHSYAEGAYQATLTVTDDDGASSAVTHSVTVTAP